MTRKFRLLIIFVATTLITAQTLQAADVDIVISEIMINAAYETGNAGEWIEIHNRGADAVDLAGWQLQDNSATDTIDAAMCPGGSCQIPAGGCWLVADSQTGLATEFANYTNPNQPTVQSNQTIFMDEACGNGLANSNDHLILRNGAGTAVDCYSWDGSDTCSGLTYLSGGDGADANYDGSDGQSVTRVQSDWYDHATNASPYDCHNTAASGPTALSLTSFSGRRSVGAPGWTLLLLALAAIVTVRRPRR